MEFFEHHQDFVAFLHSWVESRVAAEDILQTAYLKSLQQSLKGKAGRVVRWIFQVLRSGDRPLPAFTARSI